ncbi:ribosomal protein S12 methylthiotransferase accessory factor [Candidatus Pantoea symbiotica]|jgi:ribosomal protein S12 methylthiotransferase accessory factor|uniref:Ribosomal protein S12 methylthiotransferase accessory factor n=1 Tax=Candidatus Pantoea symbiotica TaxID=1884370 RepID=A0A1I3RGZ4_9GAMM|nr:MULTISPECIES: 30S ribosomal protein S12 methylthiotransferase accessory factor YcaO [Pantoea]KAJ9433626.1 30S ribosomal protein S12 methylthiotransferase accessory protein YcaO [Pantoea sp. YR343]MRT22716.1 30S ribosomal protein S12 methylthiotransferase accessory protein YcaO [Enterobacteriaceae bacterium RIT697]SFJ45545.1 ribosomal protein S12 methylthiotransferase accessory factor [Pantoea symbiotica]SFU38896.1 ribosomal protein S12 methylthiotransferase accessory factor [Pantoea sp. YR52
MTQTFIPGKDAALEDSIARFQQKLQDLGFNIEEASWLNPVPHVWSVHIRDRDCPLCFTNGKGASKKAALASALGEYFERLSTNYFFADFWLGKSIANGDFVHYPNEKWFPLTEDDSLPEGILDARLRKFYDPEESLGASELIDLQSGNDERGICGLPFTRQSDQQTVYIPMNIIGNLYVSNGMSAGNTANEARVQGLSEVFERHIKNRIIAESISLPEIPAEVMQRYPGVIEAIDRLEAEGFPIFSYDASLGGKYPVICVVLFNPANGTCFASFGAHPDFGVALERTVTELLQGRGLKDLDVFTPPTFDDEEVAEHANLETHFIDSSGLISWDMFKDDADYPFVDWSFAGTTHEEFDTLMAIFRAEDKEVYIADYEHLSVYACRIIVPGMSDIYPAEDLLLANNSMGAPLRETLLALPESQWEPEAYLELIVQLDEEGHDDFTRVRELLGLASGKDNGWYTLRIGELKAMLALAGGDLDQALIWTEWTMEFNQSIFSEERANYYRCLQTLLLLAMEEERDPLQYHRAFIRMYGQAAVEAASAAISGEAPFYGLQAVDLDLKAFPAHQSLLAAYEKLQTAKRRYWSQK